jgi:hypothetical protein
MSASDDWIKVHSDMSRAFDHGKVANATEEELQEWLRNLCTGSVPNPNIQHREIIRALTIQNIQMQRIIDRLDSDNRKTQMLFLAVAIGSIVITALGAIFG